MRKTDYAADDIRFAYANRVYLRWQIYRGRKSEPLTRLDCATMRALTAKYAIHILECETDETEARLLVSLQPGESVSAAEGKLKGQAAKWLRQESGDRFARGYFACTSGKSTSNQIDAYLQSQAEHHGYANRVQPPVFVKTFGETPDDNARLQPPHAVAYLRYHIVVATWRRRGIFGAQAGDRVSQSWQSLEAIHCFRLLKVSFVADHVHMALRVHPRVVPARIVAILMKAAQDVIWSEFAADAIQASVERLWQPSAYVGGFGDLATPQIAAYIHRWREGDSRSN